MNVITPPYPTPHNNVASYMWGSANERYYPTPPHPTQRSIIYVRKCKWTLLPHPTPPQWAKKQQKHAAVYQACANYTTPQLQLQLQLHYTHYTWQLRLHYTTTSSSCGWGDHCNHCNHSKKHNFNHLSVHQYWFALPSVIHNNQPLL